MTIEQPSLFGGAPAAPSIDLDTLNPAQREAVECTTGPLLVLAGAGSGKTRVLTYRIAHMIADEGVRPWQVLAITFTNKAAAEMRERLQGLLPGGVRGMWVCTFHAMCVRMLREDAEAIGFRPNFSIYDDDDSRRLVRDIMGDLDVDTHHTIEDLAIVFGDALTQALGDKKGINRYGMFYCPMDEALTRVVIDLSGRPYLVYDVKLAVERIGTFETEMLKEFLYALAVHGRMNLHVTNLYGENAHHIVESVFKGLGHALKEAVRIEGDETSVLSTKGVL